MVKKTKEDKKYDELVKKIEILENDQKKNNKNKKVKIALGISLGTIALAGIITTSVVLINKQTNQFWNFNKSDYVDFKNKIIQKIQNDNLTFHQFKNNLLSFTKNNLIANNKSTNDIIEDVIIDEYIGNYITLKVILNKAKNYVYSCENGSNFYIHENVLTIKFFGINFKN